MASRNWNRKQALEKEVKDLYVKVTIGGTGAPTLTMGTGIASISRTSQGLYKLTLQDKYMQLKSFNVIHLVSAAEDLTFQIKAEAVATTGVIDFFTLAAATATDPSSGAVLLIKIERKNSSAI